MRFQLFEKFAESEFPTDPLNCPTMTSAEEFLAYVEILPYVNSLKDRVSAGIFDFAKALQTALDEPWPDGTYLGEIDFVADMVLVKAEHYEYGDTETFEIEFPAKLMTVGDGAKESFQSWVDKQIDDKKRLAEAMEKKRQAEYETAKHAQDMREYIRLKAKFEK